MSPPSSPPLPQPELAVEDAVVGKDGKTTPTHGTAAGALKANASEFTPRSIRLASSSSASPVRDAIQFLFFAVMECDSFRSRKERRTRYTY
jgi:hypothetical protein